jgi:hypothetical protein
MHDTVPDSLTCSICSDKFNTTTKQPLLLQCFHTFCQDCLHKLAKPPSPIPSSGPQLSIVCPLCSQASLCSSASSLLINYALKDIVEASASVQEKMCEFHKDNHSATYWCFDCEQVCILLVQFHFYFY